MEIQRLFSIVFASLLCYSCFTQVHAQSSTDATETSTGQPSTSNPSQATSAGQSSTQGTPTSQPSTQASSTGQAATDAPTGTPTASTAAPGTPTGQPSTQASSTGQAATDAPTGASTTSTDATGTPLGQTSQPPSGPATDTATPNGSGVVSTTPTSTADNASSTDASTQTQTAAGTSSPQTPDGSTTVSSSNMTATGATDTPTATSDTTKDTRTSGSAVPDATVTSDATSTSGATEQTEPSTTPAPVVTTQGQLVTKYPSVAANTDIATYTLTLEFTGEDDTPTTSCNTTELLQELETKLKSTVGYRDIKTAGDMKVNALYQAKDLVNRPSNATATALGSALGNNPVCYNYTENTFQTAIKGFAALTTNYCSAEYICPSGYKCQTRNNQPVCTSLCEDKTCQNAGVCTVLIEDDGTAKALCSCVDTYESIYSGDECEVSKMNPERVAAIVGGVLGAVCFILLVALYCMCYRRRENKGKKYHLSGVYNETYDHASLDMKNM